MFLLGRPNREWLIYEQCAVLVCLCASLHLSALELEPTLVSAIGAVLQQRQREEVDNFIHMHYEANASVALRYYFADLVTALLLNYMNSSYSIHTQDPIKVKQYEHTELVLVDTMVSLRFVYQLLVRYSTRNRSFTVIYIADVRDARHPSIAETLAMLWQMSVLNVGIVVQDARQEQVFMLSYYPFGARNCGIARPVIVNRYSTKRSAWLSTNFFPDKLTNFHSCSLTCATWEDVPYLSIQRNASGAVTGFTGIEGELLAFFADTLNFTIKLYVLNLAEIENVYNDSDTTFKKIFDQFADFAIAALFHKPDIEMSGFYSQTDYYFMSHIQMVTNMFSDYSAYEKLAYPFNSQLWLIISATFVLGAVAIFLARCLNSSRCAFVLGPRNRVPYYNMFSLAMGATSATALPRRNFARFLLMVWMLGTLVLRAAYQSGMYELLRNDRHRNPPLTIASVLAQHYAVYMIPGNVRYLTSLPELKTVHFLNTTEVEAFPALAAAREPLAIITSYEYFAYFRLVSSRLSQSLNVVPERIFSQQLSTYVRHNSYLLDVFNERIKLAQTYGFMQIWHKRNMDDSDVAATVAAPSYGQQDDVTDAQTTLTMKELRAIFMIVVWLHIAALVSFLIELKWLQLKALYEKRRWRRRAAIK